MCYLLSQNGVELAKHIPSEIQEQLLSESGALLIFTAQFNSVNYLVSTKINDGDKTINKTYSLLWEFKFE